MDSPKGQVPAVCPTRCLQQKEGPGPQELGCCSPRPGRRQTSKLRGEKWKQRPGSSLPCSSQHAPLQADGEHHYGLGCSSPSEEGMICTVSSSALPLGTQWLCFMVNKHCTRDSWLQWRDGELMICCSSGGCAQCPVPSPSMWGVLCDPTARHFSFWETASFPQITIQMCQYHFSFPLWLPVLLGSCSH